jgi:hypothetical protein
VTTAWSGVASGGVATDPPAVGSGAAALQPRPDAPASTTNQAPAPRVALITPVTAAAGHSLSPSRRNRGIVQRS